MAAKVVLLACVQIFIQAISGQCIGAYDVAGWNPRWAGLAGPGLTGPGLAAPGLAGPGLASSLAIDYPGSPYLAASNGGGFAVSSASPISPTGVFVTSENVYDGPVYVAGQLPFLSAIALEGLLPSLGAGVVSYDCGNGAVAILSEDIAPANLGPGPYGYGSIGPNYGPGLYGGPASLGFGAGCGYGLY